MAGVNCKPDETAGGLPALSWKPSISARRRRKDMSDPKKPDPETPPETPDIDHRANEAFLDTLFDTDGRPNREAEAIIEIEGFDEDDDP